jgi:hypothetical protein
MSLRLYDFRDFDVMVKLSEQEGSGATSAELAEELGLGGTDGTRAVGSRMAWMRRFGMLDFDLKRKVWTISRAGNRVLAAKRRAALKQLVDEMPDGELIEAMAYITSRYRLGDPTLANMLRREFIYGTAPQSRVWSL